MRVAVSSPLYHLLPNVKEELLAEYPDAKINEDFRALGGDELIEFCQGYDAAVIALDRFDEYVVSRLPELKVISLCTAGTDHVDPAALKKHGVRIGWVAGINKVAVAEFTICTMNSILRNVYQKTVELHGGRWNRRPFGTQLKGKTVGIHGCGNIGKEVVKRLQPFGVKILACDRVDYPDFYQQYDVTPVEPEELWSRSEVLTIHLPLNSSTRGLYTAEVLDKLRPRIYLINAARGCMVDEDALRERLASGAIAAAHFDVFAVEPVTEQLELFKLPNFMGTPHIASNTREAYEAMARSGIKGLTENWLPEPGEYPFD